MKGPGPDRSLVEIVEDTVLSALFTAPTTPPSEPCEHAKRHCSSRTTERDKAHATKKDWTNIEGGGEPY